MADYSELGPITRRDTTSTVDVEYVGIAQSGTTDSQPGWSIMKVTKDGDEVVSTAWADGVITAKFVWNDRTTYTFK